VDREKGLYIVEVQREFHRFFGERLLHYLARLYGMGLKRGEKYREQKRALLLSILDFELFPGTGRVTSRLLVRNEEGEAVSGRFAAVRVELGKVTWKEPGELATSEEKWQHILKYAER
jgi:predicted transposase/invertase (TIGR01784 family)